MVNFKTGLPGISPESAGQALKAAAAQVKRNLPSFTGTCMNHSSVNGIYPPCANDQWTTGFWPGEIWLAWKATGDRDFLDAGQIFVEDFFNRIKKKISVDHHDMGFLYTPSCVSSWKLTKNEKAWTAAVLAAEQLCTRYQEKGRFIQAWGPMGERQSYRYIIDCLLNLPLLYWAADETGNGRYREIADAHLETCLAHSFRENGSTYHTFFMDMDTGEPLRGETCQGFRDDSSWARGQAWAVYGTAISYRYGGGEELIPLFRKVTEYYLSRLPQDLIPFWDMIFTDENTRPDSAATWPLYGPGGNTEPRDSSSAAITACGLLEMADILDEQGAGLKGESRQYREIAGQMMTSLVENYRETETGPGRGLLIHGTYSKKSPFNTCTEEGVDESLSWGDYFYMEALARITGNWENWW
ncbi:MAG: glycoside hydrolase family 88 protein [Spirochaetales bacterium]|nr:glycoside hydrolase family 88 protein [Spirochaetales bacterium]